MPCLAINKTNDIGTAYKKSRPDLILLDPEPSETQGSKTQGSGTQGSGTQGSKTQDSESQGRESQGSNVLRTLAEQHTDKSGISTTC